MNSGPIAWSSPLWKTVATSTCEAEIHAAVLAVKDAVHIKHLLKGLELIQDDHSLNIADNNAACIAQANSGIKHLRNAKHYEVRLRFLQQKSLTKKWNSNTALLIIKLRMYLPNFWMNRNSSGLEDKWCLKVMAFEAWKMPEQTAFMFMTFWHGRSLGKPLQSGLEDK